ncbi:hypothetical protein Tco_0185430, partial [Tanacetum coccineum]
MTRFSRNIPGIKVLGGLVQNLQPQSRLEIGTFPLLHRHLSDPDQISDRNELEALEWSNNIATLGSGFGLRVLNLNNRSLLALKPKTTLNTKALGTMTEKSQGRSEGRNESLILAPVKNLKFNLGLWVWSLRSVGLPHGISVCGGGGIAYPSGDKSQGKRWHRDTINAASRRNFYSKDTGKNVPELIEDIPAFTHNHWDTSANRDKTSRNISSTTTTRVQKLFDNYNDENIEFVEMMRQIQMIKSVDTKCETCGGPHSFTECPAVDGYTQEAAYATTGNYNSGGNCQALNNQGRGQNFNQGNNNYQASNFQAQVGPSNDLSNYIKTNEVNMIVMQNQINNMQTELKNEFQTSMANQNNEIKNMLSNFFQMQNPSGSGSLPSNTVANPRGDVKGITTRSGVAYDGPSISPTPSPLPKEVERETEATKDKVQSRVDYDVDPRVPLIIGRPVLRTARALIDVYGEELTLRVDDEAITFKGDILYLEKLLNEDPFPTLPPMKNDDLKQVDVTMTKPSIEEPPELEL